ncbi:MAG: hypothetical protein ACRCS8_00350, partial [Brevinema sp.]
LVDWLFLYRSFDLYSYTWGLFILRCKMLRYLLLITVLILGACAEKKSKLPQKNSVSPIDTYLNSISTNTNEVELITPEERASIIAGLEKGDYTVLDRFFETNELYPETMVQDAYIVESSIDSNLKKTNSVTFQNKGAVISYTNQYGVLFLNQDCIAFTEEEISYSLTNQYLALSQIADLTSQILSNNSTNFTKILNCIFPSTSYLMLSIANTKINQLVQNNTISLDSLNINEEELDKYIISKIEPNDIDSLKKYWINHIAWIVFKAMKKNGIIRHTLFDGF